MLNISPNSINEHIDKSRFSALRAVNRPVRNAFLRVLAGLGLGVLLAMFLPWTQTIRSGGNVTALRPDQRPQTIQSIIPGRIEKWYVQEGQFVNKGDTILYISEIKEDYMDTNLVGRTQEQLLAKEATVNSYMEKVKALDSQIDALIETSQLKLKQARNKLKQAHLKVTSDSISYEAAQTQFRISEEQFKRLEVLYKQGLKSLTDLENRKLKMQQSQAYMIEAQNKLLTSENEVLNARVELVSISANYRDKIAKAESEKYTAMSSMYDSEATVTKLQSQFATYSTRAGYYYIKAPQDGYITKAIQVGLGESIKEGASIVSIMPSNYSLAVEMYVEPIDLPLLEKGREVRIQFDGWPAIVFSGWPNTSYGTYGGKVVAIDNFISDNGKYRVLVAPDESDHPWPNALRVGAGTNSMVLLNDVPLWYEAWRQINGFPPDYYKPVKTEAKDNGKPAATKK